MIRADVNIDRIICWSWHRIDRCVVGNRDCCHGIGFIGIIGACHVVILSYQRVDVKGWLVSVTIISVRMKFAMAMMLCCMVPAMIRWI